MFLLDFLSRSHFGFCNGHGNSRTAWHVTRWSHEEVSVKMATTSDGDLSDFSDSSEPVNSPVNSLWLSQNSQTILMIFGSLLTKVKPRKIESERRSASKTSSLRISLFTSIKDRHCIQTTRILVTSRVAKRNGSDTTNLSKSPSPPMLDQCGYPANTKHLYNICTTLAQRLRRCSSIVQVLYVYKCFLFAG